MIQLEKFSDLASQGHSIAVRADNEVKGVPVLQAAPQSFKGRILSALSARAYPQETPAWPSSNTASRSQDADNAQALGAVPVLPLA